MEQDSEIANTGAENRPFCHWQGLTRFAGVWQPNCHDSVTVFRGSDLCGFAQYERAMIVQKLRGARQRIRTKVGRCEGRKAFGTRPGEAEIIQRIKELRQQGLAVDKIAEVLNAHEVKPRAGLQWYATSVYRVLKAADAL